MVLVTWLLSAISCSRRYSGGHRQSSGFETVAWSMLVGVVFAMFAIGLGSFAFGSIRWYVCSVQPGSPKPTPYSDKSFVSLELRGPRLPVALLMVPCLCL